MAIPVTPSGVYHSSESQKCGRNTRCRRSSSRSSCLIRCISGERVRSRSRSLKRTSSSLWSGRRVHDRTGWWRRLGIVLEGACLRLLLCRPHRERLKSLREAGMKVKAAICWEPRTPLQIDEIDLEGPKAGECLVRLAATGVCHTDAYTMSGRDPSGLFPAVLGHEGDGGVAEIGSGVTSLTAGDHVIPLYIPECRRCKFCLSGKTNLCGAILATQGKGVMPDGTSRLSHRGRKLHHYMGTSTFAQYTVVPEIALAKVRADAPLEKICLLGCGITTGIGAVLNTAKVPAGATVAVFGLGGVGLSVVQGAVMVGASRIIGVDINPKKFTLARQF